ncbi:MAG: precorrin-6y C5,15-methyltransferase (decarboxylating) subunit CbiE [Deltaproteobacteria bacterium]|nr:precorrin-6y C5,15-methyltransferase (decarboxylating) subunit CbiE [Deltaproteobacteria bacterium]
MIYIIGLGMEGKSSLSPRALKLIDKTSLLIGGRRHLASFPEFKGRKIVIGSNLEDIEKILNRKSKIGNRKWSVVLASGDPNFFGIADFLVKKLGKDAVEIIPNVSTMQYVFAKIKDSWNDARFLSVHGRSRGQILDARCKMQDARNTDKESSIGGIVDEIVCHNKVGIFTDPENTPSKIAKMLLDKGVKDYQAYVCEDLGTDKEKITRGTLTQITRKKFSPLNVMILIRGQGVKGSRGQDLNPRILEPSNSVFFGIPDSAFSHSNGMITKEEIRVISLSKLKLKRDSIIWDIGSGSGSLSIEAAMFAKDGRVFAVEKEKTRIAHIEKNKKRFGTINLEIIHANASDSLKTLPTPDAVFIGGGGKDVVKILDVCSKRLKQGGRIIVNAITLETLAAAAGFFKKKKWNVETISVNIAKTKDVAVRAYGHTPLHIFNAHNPVFIVVGEPPHLNPLTSTLSKW